jgi:ABC-type transporter MlaC component
MSTRFWRLAAPAAASLAAALLLALAAAPGAAEAAGKAPATPTEAVHQANDALRAALKKLSAAQGPAWEKARDEARAAVASLLDFEALAEGTLGKHWSELKQPERTRYVASMRAAMEASYLSRMQGKLSVEEVKVNYLGEEKKAGRPIVKTQFVAGKDVAAIDYVFASDKKLRAVDVLTEGVSLAETYRESIAGLWPKKGFDGVVAAFDKKAKRFEAELEEKRKQAAPAAKQ